MSMPSSFTFYAGCGQDLVISLADPSGAAISNASVFGTLYYGRSKLDAKNVPGDATIGFTNVSCVESETTLGTYVGSIGYFGDFNPDIMGGDYTLVVNATKAETTPIHEERPAVVVRVGP